MVYVVRTYGGAILLLSQEKLDKAAKFAVIGKYKASEIAGMKMPERVACMAWLLLRLDPDESPLLDEDVLQINRKEVVRQLCGPGFTDNQVRYLFDYLVKYGVLVSESAANSTTYVMHYRGSLSLELLKIAELSGKLPAHMAKIAAASEVDEFEGATGFEEAEALDEPRSTDSALDSPDEVQAAVTPSQGATGLRLVSDIDARQVAVAPATLNVPADSTSEEASPQVQPSITMLLREARDKALMRERGLHYLTIMLEDGLDLEEALKATGEIAGIAGRLIQGQIP